MMIESTPTEESAVPALHVDLAQVCVVDGVWQDMPDHLAAFDEARLGASAHGRGQLYVLLDVSGEVEGRAEVERELIETIRREYGARRGSITFALSEALRAANGVLFQLNLSVAREARRMSGISAVVLRGQDLYIAQAGPAVVYAEVAGTLHRFPAESDWFNEDQPLINPQGNASAPLGVRREFACDLFHTPVAAGDVFVLATRALTQLAGTEELAQAFKDRGAEDIADFLEDAANSSDLSAIVAELVDPRDLQELAPQGPDQVQPEFNATAEPTGGEPEPEGEWIPWPESTVQAMTPAPPTAAPDVESPVPAASEAEPAEERLAQLREERRLKRQAQLGALGHAIRGVGTTLVGGMAAIGAVLLRATQVVDWERLRDWFNRALNTFFFAAWRLLALLVRLILPGAVPKQPLMPRRASKEPIWLKGAALVLPVLLVALAFSAYYTQDLRRAEQAAALVQQAQTALNQAKILKESDKNAARLQLKQALALVDEAQTVNPAGQPPSIRFEIQDQLNEVNDIDVLYHLLSIAPASPEPSDLAQVVADDNNIYFLDRGAGRIYHYVVNESATQSGPDKDNGVILQTGAKVGNVTVDRIRDIAWAVSADNTKSWLVAVTGNALLQYDPGAGAWRAPTIVDTSAWGEIRAVASYNGNLYLLDATKNQLWKYLPTANGYSPQATPYLPANSGADFSHAVDLAIDGEVWVLNSDGTLLRFRMGQRVPFEMNGLDVPLKNPAALSVPPEANALYIADAGNQRLVEFDKTGRYVRQFKPWAKEGTAFEGLRALFASESKRKFYFISSGGVYLANIP